MVPVLPATGRPIDDEFGAGAVVDVVEPGTGHVRAMAVNRRYSEQELPGHSKVNLAIGGSSGFQAGSTFKPFVLAEAIKQGVPLGFTLYAPQKYTSKVFKDYVDGKVGPYTPSNAGDSQSGRFTLETATHASVNTYYVQLEERVGVEPAAALAESLGVKQFQDGVPSAPLLRGGAFVLGANEVSPLDMASAYATFAARGLYCPPRPVTQVLDSRGQQIELGGPGCAQVLEQPVADTINSVLTGIIDGNTRGRTGRAASIGRPAAGKTGSTNGSKAAWFVGYTPQLATAVWLGDPGAPGREVQDMRSVRINGRFYPQVFGGTIPAGIWQKAMSAAMEGFPVVGFEKPARDAIEGREVAVPDVRGLPQDVAESTLISAGFGVRKGGRVSAAPVPAGAAAYTSPRAGRKVPFGTSVTLFISTGRKAAAGSTAPSRDRPPARQEPVTPPGGTTPEKPATGPKGRGNGRGNN